MVDTPNTTAKNACGWMTAPEAEPPLASKAGSGCVWNEPVRRPPSVPADSGVVVWSEHVESGFETYGPLAAVPPGCTMRNQEPVGVVESHLAVVMRNNPLSASPDAADLFELPPLWSEPSNS